MALQDELATLARDVAAALIKFANSIEGVYLHESPPGHQIPGVPTSLTTEMAAEPSSPVIKP
jgi:hypothetical protein